MVYRTAMDNPVENLDGSSVNYALGRNVAAEIRRANARQKDVAAYLGLSPQSFSGRVRGHTPFTVSELLRVADYLGLELDVLLGRSTPPNAHNPRYGNFELVTTPMYQGVLFGADDRSWEPQVVNL